MGALAQKVNEARPVGKGCSFARWFETLDNDDKKVVVEVMNDPAWSVDRMRVFFQSEGCVTGDKTLRAHRRGECPTCRIMK